MIVPGYRLHSMEWNEEDAKRVKSQLMENPCVEDVIVSDTLEVLVKDFVVETTTPETREDASGFILNNVLVEC